MKTYLRSKNCDHCGHPIDPTFPTCPKCGEENPSLRGDHAFDHHVHDRIPFQIVCILIQTIGLFLVGLVVSLIVEVAFIALHPGATVQEITDYLSTVEVNFPVNAAGYVTVLGGFAILFGVRKRFGELFRSFRDYKNILFGLLGGGVIILASYLYGYILTGIFTAAGMEIPGPNANEQLVRQMVKTFPVLSLFVFGLIGPLTEEIGYRVGLFGFTSRFGKWVGYLVSSVIFGLVHFDVTSLGSGDTARLIVELANLPSYVGAGLCLAFLYDRFGLAGSYTAHTVNNLCSLIITLVGE